MKGGEEECNVKTAPRGRQSHVLIVQAQIIRRSTWLFQKGNRCGANAAEKEAEPGPSHLVIASRDTAKCKDGTVASGSTACGSGCMWRHWVGFHEPEGGLASRHDVDIPTHTIVYSLFSAKYDDRAGSSATPVPWNLSLGSWGSNTIHNGLATHVLSQLVARCR